MLSLKLFLHGSLACALFFATSACNVSRTSHGAARQTAPQQTTTTRVTTTPAPVVKPAYASPVLERLVAAAIERTSHAVKYDPAYFKLAYPNGDVPPEKGVCTDEVIRSYRALGIDLQKEVHEDMQANFALYPTKFGLTATDANIDHRRVPNLRVFLARKGASLPITSAPEDYKPGDLVTWDLNDAQTHIGIVVDAPSPDAPGRYLIMHNIGAGPTLDDALFNWKITGHYRYTGPPPSPPPPAVLTRQPARKPVHAPSH